jgi:nucleoside-diphosphate-sugar epimerase
MNKTVLVTGANGFIGRHVIQPLQQLGFTVYGVSRSTPVALPCTWHEADLLDPLQIQKLMAIVQPTHLLHLAWYAVPGQYWQSPENFRWVQASLELARQFQAHGGHRLVAAGSCAEYDWRYGYCQEQLTPKLPQTPYGVCKHALAELLESYGQLMGLSTAWGRVFFLYGSSEHPDRLVASVVRSLLRGEVARCSHGKQIRDFLHVHDVANAFAALLASEVSGSVNIASGVPLTLKAMIYAIAEQLQATSRISLGAIPAAANDVSLLVADATRLHQEVGWQPIYTLEQGVAHTIRWWQDHLEES